MNVHLNLGVCLNKPIAVCVCVSLAHKYSISPNSVDLPTSYLYNLEYKQHKINQFAFILYLNKFRNYTTFLANV